MKLGANSSRKSDVPVQSAEAEAASSEAVKRCVGLLVQGLIIHSPRLEDATKAEFSHEMSKLLARTQQSSNPEHLLPVLSSILDNFAGYGKKVERYAENVEKELSAMLILLCEELLQRGLPPAIEECLGKLGGEISDAKTLQDFIQTRKNLQKAFEWQISDHDANGANRGAKSDFDLGESPTGFPGPVRAKEYLTKTLGQDDSIYVVMFKLSALHVVEQRYGVDAAQDYLNATAQYMVQSMKREDRLFHWSRDILLAVLDRRITETSIRMELYRLVAANREQVIEVNGRKVMISNPITFDIRGVKCYSNTTDLFAAFEPFLSESL